MSENTNGFIVSSLKNLTTEVNLIKNVSGSLVEAIEFDAHHVVFDLAQSSCGQGQLVQIEGILKIKGQKMEFSATGKVKTLTQIGGGRSKVTIELHTYDKDIWNQFHRALSDDQKRADKLFRSIKGEE